MADQNESNTPEQGSTDSPLSRLVGEGRKFASVEELAKSYEHANNFIPQLESQIEVLKEDKEKTMSLMELYESKNNTSATNSNEQKPNTEAAPELESKGHQPEVPGQSKEEGSPVNVDDLVKTIKSQLENEKTTETRRSNVQRVQDSLLEAYGSQEKVDSEVARIAAELNVGQEFLMSTAADAPDAFFKLTGLEAKPSKKADFEGTVNTDGFSNKDPQQNRAADTSTKAYYDDLLKTDKSKWLSRDTQLAMHKAAMENPDRFYGRN